MIFSTLQYISRVHFIFCRYVKTANSVVLDYSVKVRTYLAPYLYLSSFPKHKECTQSETILSSYQGSNHSHIVARSRTSYTPLRGTRTRRDMRLDTCNCQKQSLKDRFILNGSLTETLISLAHRQEERFFEFRQTEE